MKINNNDLPENVQLLLKHVAEIAEKNAITPHYDRIMKYIEEIPLTDIDNTEQQIRKAKFVLNKQLYEETIERHGPKAFTHTPEFMDKIGSIWNFSRAGETFVTNYRRGKSND